MLKQLQKIYEKNWSIRVYFSVAGHAFCKNKKPPTLVNIG